jgi:anaerobic ribonucleoside-triphosphate reductase
MSYKPQTREEINAEIARLERHATNYKGTRSQVYSRVTGYYGEVRKFNKGKRQEFAERKTFEVPA